MRRLVIEPALVDALVRDAEGADALQLLAFTLERLFSEFGADSQLTLARYEAMGGVGGSIDRALAEAQRKAGARGGLEALRRLIVPGLATWDATANAAKRLVARQPDLIGGGRAELAPLADALVEARLLTRERGTIEVAHEALLRRAPISLWLEAQKEALKLRDDVLREAREWHDGGRKAKDLVRRGERLTIARDLFGQPDFAGALAPAREAGQFMMGEKGKQRAVTVAGPFAVSKFAVTFDQWDACVAGGGCGGYAPNDAGWGRGIQPVIYVSWIDAQHYVEWLNRMTGTGGYRLLSEAEFEYAARAETTTEYPWGDEIGNGNANCDGCGSRWDSKQTAPVGSFKADGFGLYDMEGNVWQWVEDAYSADVTPSDGTAGSDDGTSSRVLRGGSWLNSPEVLRSAKRYKIRPGGRDIDIGFRVARTLSPPSPTPQLLRARGMPMLR